MNDKISYNNKYISNNIFKLYNLIIILKDIKLFYRI